MSGYEQKNKAGGVAGIDQTTSKILPTVIPLATTSAVGGVTVGSNINVTAGAISIPQSVATSATPSFANATLSNNTNQLVLGTTNTMTQTMASQTANHIFTLPNANCNPVQPASLISGTWVKYIDSTGTQYLTQPAFTDISGTAQIAQGGTNATTYTSGQDIYFNGASFASNGNTYDGAGRHGIGGAYNTSYQTTINGTGTYLNNSIIIYGQGDGGTPTQTTISGAAASGTNVTGGDVYFRGTGGTGSGNGGSIRFQTAIGANALPVIASSTQFTTGNVNTYSTSYNAGNSLNMLLVVEVVHGASATVNTMTYNGIAMTKLSSEEDQHTTCWAEIWYLIAPAIGSNTLAINFTGYITSVIQAINVTGANQTTPFGTPAVTNGTTSPETLTVTGTNSNILVIDCIAMGGGAPTISGGQTAIWNTNTGTGVYGAGSYITGSATNTTVSYTSSNNNYAYIAAGINGVSGTIPSNYVTVLQVSNTGNCVIPNNLTVGGSIAGTVSTTTNLAGGAQYSTPYQTGVGATGFIATANSSVYTTNSSGLPSWATTIPVANLPLATGSTAGVAIVGSNISVASGTISIPQSVAATATPTFASETLTANTNQLVLGTTNTMTVTTTAQTASHVLTLPNASCNPIVPNGSATANNWVQYIGANGVQNLAQPAFTNISGTATIAQGGTGQTTAQLAINALSGAVTSAQYLRGNGTNIVMSGIQASDVPTLNQSTTGNANTATNLQNSSVSIPALVTIGTGLATNPLTSVASDLNSLLSAMFLSGSWTPTFYGMSTAGTYTLSSGGGKYRTSGNICLVECYATFTTSVAGTGNCVFGGLPFPNPSGFPPVFANAFLAGATYTDGSAIALDFGSGFNDTGIFIQNSGQSSITSTWMQCSAFASTFTIGFSVCYAIA